MRRAGFRSLVAHSSASGRILGIAVLVGFVFIAQMLLPQQDAHATSVAGGGGGAAGGGGGSGYAIGSKGWGWYMYSVNGNPQPVWFKDNSSWGSVSGLCKAAGADKVVAFILLTQKGGGASAGAVYKYYTSGGKTGLDLVPKEYLGGSGGDWLPTSTAYNMFMSLDPSVRDLYQFGGNEAPNNIAWFCYSTSTHWAVSSYTGIKKDTQTNINSDSGWGTSDITAKPGETIYWKHTLTAADDTIDKTVNWGLQGSGFPSSFQLTNSSGSVAAGTPKDTTFVSLGQYKGGNASYTLYTITQNEVGSKVCQHIDWSPTSWNTATGSSSASVCASVPYDYTLTPTVSIPSTEAEVGSAINVQANVANNGPTKSKSTTWQISYITAPSGVAIPPAINNSSAPCVYYQGAGRTCAVATFTSGGAATGLQVFDVGNTLLARQAVTADLPVGTQVCYALSVQDRSSSSGQWAHSAPACVVVSKRPVVQITGSDLIVGRGMALGSINTNVKTLGGTRYGSWGEYGIIASGLVNGMASASGYAGGTSAANLCSVSYLTFSNRAGLTSGCSDANIGRYTFKLAASTISSRFPTSSASPISGLQSIDGLASGATYTSNVAGSDILLTSSAKVPAGKWVVINAPNATVRIMNNIVYTDGALPSISQIPQVVIIAKNIVIADSVTQVDAWLVATGTGATDGRVNTCAVGGVNEAAVLTSLVCANKLTINGPVVANHLLLHRTAGAGTGAASGDPAEVFNLRPDAYLWAANLQTSTVKAQTVRTIELPPRY